MNIRTFVAILSRNPRYNFLKMRGGSKAVWNFSENSSILEGVGVPKGRVQVKRFFFFCFLVQGQSRYQLVIRTQI